MCEHGIYTNRTVSGMIIIEIQPKTPISHEGLRGAKSEEKDVLQTLRERRSLTTIITPETVPSVLKIDLFFSFRKVRGSK